MAGKRKAPAARTEIRGRSWKKSRSVATEKFDAVSRAVLASLTSEPIRFSDLVERVRAKLPGFEGSVSWYTITSVRELEMRGDVLRHERPVLYSKRATRPRR